MISVFKFFNPVLVCFILFSSVFSQSKKICKKHLQTICNILIIEAMNQKVRKMRITDEKTDNAQRRDTEFGCAGAAGGFAGIWIQRREAAPNGA
jgi:hypothetical protein